MVFACKVYFTSVFTQAIDLYTKNENNLHETLIIKRKKVIYKLRFVWKKRGNITSYGVCVVFIISYAIASQKMCNMLHKKREPKLPFKHNHIGYK
jgi:hypothetical protein